MTLSRSFYNAATTAYDYLALRWPKAIWQAVLEQAINDIVKGPAAFEMRGMTPEEARKLRLEFEVAAQCWIDDDTNEPRCFVWVCEQLGLEPAAVRKSIEERTK